MTENLLEAAPLATIEESEQLDPTPAPVTRAAPEGVPEKFWDPENGTLRTDALVKSYRELERRLGSTPARDVPSSPEEYEVEPPNELLTSDPDVNARLHEAGFTQDQVQVAYNLAAEKLMPMVAEIASVFEAERQVERLVQDFGGQDRWRQASRNINTWGRANLPDPVFAALSTTRDGVMAMYEMMNTSEPNLSKVGVGGTGTPNEADLKQMMRDPKYWRDQDPAFVQRVRDGFQRLFPS